MAKKLRGRTAEVYTIVAAAAVHLEIETERCTAKQCLNRMLERVRELTKNPKLTMDRMKLAISHWLTEGWVMISGETIQVLRAGRARIKQLADEATRTPEQA